MFNVLESRRLLSASSVLVAGKLSITGSSAADVIAVNLLGSSIHVVSGSSTTSFVASAVKSIYANLLAGNDKITIATSIFIPTSIKGGTGDDTIIGGNGNDILRGEAGNDSIIGNWGNDLLDGNTESDTLLGGRGDDTFTSGPGNDNIDGGNGSDTVDYSARITPINVSIYLQGNSYNNGVGGEGNEKDSYHDIETVIGGHGDDQIKFQHWQTTIYDEPDVPGLVINKNYKLLGGPGNDTLFTYGIGPGGDYNVTLDGGSGNDLIISRQAFFNTSLFGGDGDDIIVTHDGYPRWSGPDHEYLDVDTLPKLIDGGAGNDVWELKHEDSYESNGVITLYDNPVTYYLPDSIENAQVGSDSSVKIVGNARDNAITVTSGYGSTIIGGGGNDTLDASSKVSFHFGGYGGTIDVTTSAYEDPGPSTIYGGDGDDHIIGSKSSDLLHGQSGNDLIDGKEGNDIITGGLGRDSLFGNVGNDTFYANDGAIDLINGGPGTDKVRGDLIDQLVRVESTF